MALPQIQMLEDLTDHLRLLEPGEDWHFAATVGTTAWVDSVNFFRSRTQLPRRWRTKWLFGAEIRAHEVQIQESSRIALGGRFGFCLQRVSIQTLGCSSLVLRRWVRIAHGHLDTGVTQELTHGDNVHAS